MVTPFLQREISTFNSAFQNDKPGKATVSQLLENIRCGKYKPVIDKLRSTKDKTQYEALKKKLPGVTLSAVLSSRDAKLDLCDKLISHSGLLQVDIDHVEDLPSLRSRIDADQYTAFSFISPGGNGLKVGVRIDPTRHAESYQCVADYYQKTFGVKIDPKVKEVPRLLFVSYDPDVFVNESAKVFPVTSNGHSAQPIPINYQITPIDISESRQRYGLRAIEKASRIIAESNDGEKLDALLRAGHLLGGYIAGGMLGESEAKIALRQAIEAKPNVNSLSTAYKAIDDSIEHGKTMPIDFNELEIERQNYLTSINATNATSATTATTATTATNAETCNQRNYMQPECNYHATNATKTDSLQKLNPVDKVREWLNITDGVFTLQDLARELQFININTLKSILTRLTKQENILERVGTKSGVYQKIDKTFNRVELFATEPEEYLFPLPLGLSNWVVLEPGNLIVVAGDTNAAKTAFLLEACRLNIKTHKIRYINSEMSTAELNNRLRRYKNVMNIDEWHRVEFGTISTNFHHHVLPDDVTVIDYIDIHEEFYRLGGIFLQIHERLCNGICLAAIQKRSGASVGKGGDATMEKCRLYVTLNRVEPANDEPYMIARIAKCKQSRKEDMNANGLIRTFRVIHRGTEFDCLDNWHRPTDKEKQLLAGRM